MQQIFLFINIAKATETYLFTKYDAERSANRNFTYVNAVMATSATLIIRDDIYMNGGVQTSNPTMRAVMKQLDMEMMRKNYKKFNQFIN